jgi:hypothetical protein
MNTTAPEPLEIFKASFQKMLANRSAIGEKIEVSALFPPSTETEGEMTEPEDDVAALFPESTETHRSIASMYLDIGYDLDGEERVAFVDAIKKSIENKSRDEAIASIQEHVNELHRLIDLLDEETFTEEFGTHPDSRFEEAMRFQKWIMSVIEKETAAFGPKIAEHRRIASL